MIVTINGAEDNMARVLSTEAFIILFILYYHVIELSKSSTVSSQKSRYEAYLVL